ncbi:cytochrome P450 [Colletotrichum zoysiae]|uniref:Cytochrome P450 n=1 Tax=Colletotrichum zoysiae TaxID=1216348 RepID=A0AAD9H9H1_9PEZI|nr:cytochrome P450 [Colletotrichum zoysiae]
MFALYLFLWGENKCFIEYHGFCNRERIFITEPDAAKEFERPAAYKFVKHGLQTILSELILGHGLLTLKGDEHKQVRKRLNLAFSQTNLKACFPRFWQTAINALNIIPLYTDGNDGRSALDHSPKSIFAGATSIQIPISAVSIDMIGLFLCTTKFGKDVRYDKDKPKRFSRTFMHMFKTTHHGQLTLEVASIIGPNIALRLPLREVETIKNIMGLFHGMMRAIVGVHMISGDTEASISTATWAMHLLSRHPEVQAHLRDEIGTNAPSPYDQAGSSVGQTLPCKLLYLNAVANEVLRHRPINGLLWRDCIDPAMIGSWLFSPWCLDRDPKHWALTPVPRHCIDDQYAREQLLWVISASFSHEEGLEIGDNFALTLFKVLDGWKLHVRKIPRW